MLPPATDLLAPNLVHELMPHLDLRAEHRVVEVACASGCHCLEFARRGIRRIIGADRCAQRIATAKERAAREGLDIEFHTLERNGRFPFNGGRQFDRALLLANALVIGDHAPEPLLREITNFLTDDGRLLIEVSDGDWLRQHFAPRSWRWIDHLHFVCHERARSDDGSHLICREVLVRTDKGILADQQYIERLHTLAEVESQLRKGGFQITAQQTIAPGRRVLLTAERAQNPAVSMGGLFANSPRAKAREITVLLGDPGRPDETKRGGVFNPDDLEVVQKLRKSIASLSDYHFTFLDRHDTLLDDLERLQPALVLNLCDEGFQNIPTRELHVPALLETLGLSYSGAAPACLALCYDKHSTALAAADLGVPVPREVYCPNAETPATLPGEFPLLVKPNCGDGSFGITRDSVVHSREELARHLGRFRARWPGQPALIQEFLPGREYTVALIGNPATGFRMLPIVESDFRRLTAGLPKICGFESKEVPDNPYWEEIDYPAADLSPAERQRIFEMAARLFQGLGCRDYARFDLRADAAGTLRLIDANPNPGYNYLGYMAELEGSTYPAVLRLLIETAQARLP